jgi:hypothetical protein
MNANVTSRTKPPLITTASNLFQLSRQNTFMSDANILKSNSTTRTIVNTNSEISSFCFQKRVTSETHVIAAALNATLRKRAKIDHSNSDARVSEEQEIAESAENNVPGDLRCNHADSCEKTEFYCRGDLTKIELQRAVHRQFTLSRRERYWQI